MKTTLDIPDDLYRQAKMLAARENRKMKDIVSEGLRLALGLSSGRSSGGTRRMAKPPVIIRKGNVLPVLTNDAMAKLLENAGERLP